jgi:hypothetical protein
MDTAEIYNNSRREYGLTSRAARGLQDQVPVLKADKILRFLLKTCNIEKKFPFFLF